MSGVISLEKYCDLHIHSSYSDGSCTPSELIERAKALSLSAVALTDHNTLEGIPEFLASATERGVEAVAGIEISAEYNKKEIHVVGLFISEDRYAPLNEYLKNVRQKKEMANFELYRSLRAAGYDIIYERIFGEDKKGSINRVHFANELIRGGYISTVAEGFSGILSEARGFYKPAKRSCAFEVIDLLCSLNITSVLAHPFLNLSYDELRAFLPQARARGLVAIETDYSLFSAEQTAAARAIADEFGLMRSGGSDFHGTNKPDISLGTGKGNLRVPADYYAALRQNKYKFLIKKV